MPRPRYRFAPMLVPLLRLAILLPLALGGCGVVVPDMEEVLTYARRFRDDPPAVPLLDRAYAAMQRGHYADAETYLNAALNVDAANPYAFLNLGVVFEHTGRAAQARDIYRDLVRRKVDDVIVRATEPGFEGKTVAELARHNLARMEAGGRVPRDTGRPTVPYRLRADGSGVAERFATLERLRAADLISAEEHAARRQANLGALLPRTHPRPSADLSPTPAPLAEIMDRLRTLMAAIRPGRAAPPEGAAEREQILDRLLPATPGTGGPVATPPADPAAAITELQQSRSEGLITPQEFEFEHRAIGAPFIATDLPPPARGPGSFTAPMDKGPVAAAPAPPVTPLEGTLGELEPAAGPTRIGPPIQLQPRRPRSSL
ncbi:MAG: tetratricopeptide repeat protein [Alphaproteobacteria bacterium]|nr:tetratricopeptide repeat protein [Alphaproteobacteria bacterium]